MAGEKLKLFSETYSNMISSGILNTYAPNSEPFRVILLRKLSGTEANTLPLMTKYIYGAPQPPIIESTPPIVATVDIPWKYTIVYSDPDIPVENLTLTVENMPYGMIRNGNILTWLPTETQTSSNIKLIVSDNNSGTANDEQLFSITVSEPSTELTIASTPISSINVNTEFNYEILTTGVDPLTVSFTLTDAPVGMIITDNIITWTPQSPITESGIVILSAESTVNPGYIVEQQFNINVNYPASSIPEDALDLARYEIPQSESYLKGGKIINGTPVVRNDQSNVVLTTDALLDIKWTDLTAEVQGFAIIGSIPRLAPEDTTFEVIGYQYLDNQLSINKDDLSIKWPNVNINGIDTQYIVRLKVQ